MYYSVLSFKLSHFRVSITFSKLDQVSGGDRGAGGPGEKGAGGVREAGEEGAGSGILEVVGSGRKREKLCNIAQYFTIEKMQRGGAKKYRAGTGIKGYGKWEVQPPVPHFPKLEPPCTA